MSSVEASAQVGDIDKKAWQQRTSTITGGIATKAVGATNNNKPKPTQLAVEQRQTNELMQTKTRTPWQHARRGANGPLPNIPT